MSKTRASIILLSALLAVIAVIFIINRMIYSKAAFTVMVQLEDEISYYPLNEDRKIELAGKSGKNVIVIEKGSVHMEEADCPDGLCIKQGTISKAGQTIVCLPHKVVVTLSEDGEGKGEVDSVAR